MWASSMVSPFSCHLIFQVNGIISSRHGTHGSCPPLSLRNKEREVIGSAGTLDVIQKKAKPQTCDPDELLTSPTPRSSSASLSVAARTFCNNASCSSLVLKAKSSYRKYPHIMRTLEEHVKKSTPWLYLIHASQFGNDFVAVSLVDKETLPLGGIVHFHCVLWHQWIEEGIVFLSSSTCKKYPINFRSAEIKGRITQYSPTFLGTQNTSKSLCLLTSRSSMGWDLNQDIGLREIKRVICHLKQK